MDVSLCTELCRLTWPRWIGRLPTHESSGPLLIRSRRAEQCSGPLQMVAEPSDVWNQLRLRSSPRPAQRHVGPLPLNRSPARFPYRAPAPAGGPPAKGCTYSDRGPDQGFPSGSVRLVRNAGTVPMMADESLLRSRGETWGPVSPDNVHETGVLPLDILDCPSWPPRRSRSSELEQRPGHGPDPRFMCPTGMVLGQPLVDFRSRSGPAPPEPRAPLLPWGESATQPATTTHRR
jgi:hypothetical protein